jgi:hypothetical protein
MKLGSCATLACVWLHCKLQTRPLVREGALHEKQKEIVTQRNLKSSHLLQWGLDTDRRSQYNSNLNLKLSFLSDVPALQVAVATAWKHSKQKIGHPVPWAPRKAAFHSPPSISVTCNEIFQITLIRIISIKDESLQFRSKNKCKYLQAQTKTQV